MDLFELEFNEYEAKYIQISEHIKMLINCKIISDGEKLPTIRVLAQILKVNKVTIVNSYKKLQNDGYAVQKMGSGTYAKRRETIEKFKLDYKKEIKKMKNENEYYKSIDFTGESSKETFFPIDNFKKVISNILERDGAKALTAQETLGYYELRKTISDTFWNSKLDIDNILIVSGAQQGIDIVSKGILNLNDNVIVEKPTYGGALSVFKWRRANIFSVPIINDGVEIKALESILKKNKIKCFYTMSYFHNPTGITYSKGIKEKILELAEKYDFYIIEDDYLSELIYDKNIRHEPFKSMDKNNRVIYIRSFSKVFLPGIRLGYISYPDIFKESMHISKVNTDIATSALMQRALELYIRNGYSKEHMKNTITYYSSKYNIMRGVIDSELREYVEYIDPKGGLSFYLKFKDNGINSKELFYKLISKNVYITPGAMFYNNIEDGLDTFKISFEQVSEEDIKNGIRIIKEELEGWHI